MHTYLEIIFRTIAAFVLLMITSRMLGKQTISNMTFHDFVSGITLGSIAANLAFNDKLSYWLIAISLLLFFGISFLVSKIALENRAWNQPVSGTPTVIIENGKIIEDNLAHNGLTVQWLEQVLRQRGKSVSDVFYAVQGTQKQLYFDYYQDHIDKPID
ncbi:hypothetical protein D3C73_973760 [compost metagenome]